MRAITLGPDGQRSGSLQRDALTAGFDEGWVQDLIFRNPGILPLDEIRYGSGSMIPLARELSLPKIGGAVFLDILGVTAQGRLVLVECKLWRNPQARREVIAQILEYSALLRQRSFADLTAQLKTRHGLAGDNPIFEAVRAKHPDIDEARFTDAVARSLERRDFELIVAGDGIREDVLAIAELLQDQGASLSLVELQVWSDTQGGKLVVPHVPFRTEVHKLRVYVDAEDRPMRLEVAEDDPDTSIGSPAPQNRTDNREFWQRFIDSKPFDHPDQPKVSHGGNNWVRISMPGNTQITAYRYGPRIGMALQLKDRAVFNMLEAQEEEIRAEVGLDGLRFHRLREPGERDTIGIDVALASLGGEAGQHAWLRDTGNRLINALRPRLAAAAERG